MGVSLQSVTMKSFAILASLLGWCLGAPTATHVASGEPAGPLTLAFGDAVHTPKGLRSYSLEGFSEDVDQDGFVDPIGQAVVVAPAVAQVSYTVPKVTVPVSAPVTYTVPKISVAAPAITYTVPVAAVISYTGVEAKYASEPVVGKLQYLPGFAPFTGVPFVGGLAPAVAPAVEAVEAAAPVEAAGEGVEAV